MLAFPIRWRLLAAMALAASLACVSSPSAYGQKPKITKVKPQKSTSDQPSVEPDKVLYDKAMAEIKRAHFIEARLSLQTLVNTYPDSEYLAKAKLAVADSYFKEGGTSNMTLAIEEYKNFIVFFPFLDEAAYAQMQVAMAHYRMMEKTDRDNSQALAAETELQIFLQKYPASPLHGQAEQSLREVQEVLADGEFRIGRFYYVRGRANPVDYSAAAARLIEVSERYPLYSDTDQALWMLGDIYERVKGYSKNEDDKNHWGDLAARCYSRIVADYPLSKMAPAAKARLEGMGLRAPAADPTALARMQKDAAYQKAHHNSFLNAPRDAVRTNPAVYDAAHAGEPTLNAPDDAVSATEVLKQGATGPLFGADLQRANAAADAENSNAGAGAPNIIEGAAADSGGPSVGAGPTAAAEIIEAPSGAPAGSAAAPASDSSSSSSPLGSGGSGTADVPAAVVSTPSAPSQDSSGASTPTGAPTGAESVTSTPATAGGDSSSASAAAAQPTVNTGQPAKESTSKKKKGLHKLNPF